MTAKIKSPQNKREHHGRPKGISHHAFEKVYWPFIPVLVSVCLLLTLAVQAVPLHHLTGHVMGYQTSEDINALLKDTNSQRLSAGEHSLKLNGELTRAAQTKAEDMAKRNYWSHNTPEGMAPWTFVSASGYSYRAVGENLAAGFADDDAVVNAWMASEHHRDNILNSNYSEVGFGYANSPDFKATGGPSTIVVAYYAQPAASIVVASAPNPTIAQASLINNNSAQHASRVATVISNSSLSRWAPVVLFLAAGAGIVIFIEKHRRYFKNSLAKSERYILRHPLTDLGLLAITLLAVLLLQTAGYTL